ncbi:eukaryotic initiation factor 3 gamma subunit family protein [Tasmannia lanceolata]|uniref:eukaryotic initiation factor 3 gamma subunit family protein n=1 Tax=Tasmannia lanceolata TaxID=3420 RepID=UPI0040637C33
MAESGSSKADPLQNPNPRITWEGCSVLLDINDGDRLVFARLSPSSTLKIGNKKCSLRPLIGCPFGSLFQVETGSKGPYLLRVSATTQGNHLKEQEDSPPKDNKDNRALLDNNTAQSLSGEDIDSLRREGATGDQIIEALIANSSTFGNKTLFSQEKYRLKKQKKYAPRVLLRRPFARSICEAYFKKHPARIGFLRVDTLSLLLSIANVGAYSDVLVVDMVGGIVTGAVAERLGGTSYVCNTYFGITPYPMDIVGIFNFNNEICDRIVQSPLADLCFAQKENVQHSIFPLKPCSVEIQSNANEASLSSEFVSSISDGKNVQEENPTDGKIVQEENPTDDLCVSSVGSRESSKSAKPGRRASPGVIKLWKENGFSSLIIAAPELDMWSAVQELLPLLSYSAPFAIYHQYLQPLATCMHKLQAEKMAIGLQISEPWLREYQVLPCRTHPCMQMSAFGGYILSGIRICSS